MDSVTTLKNDDADSKLVLNPAQGEYVKTWDKQSATKCGPLGTDTVNPTVLSWETQSAYRSTGTYTVEWQIIAHKQLGFGQASTLITATPTAGVTINAADESHCEGVDSLEKSTLTCSIGAEGEFDASVDAWAQTWKLEEWTLPDQPFYNSRSPRPDADDATGVYHVYDLILKGSSKGPN